MTDFKALHQKPEGALIESALAGPPKVSLRELARRIGMSDARVRQIVNGYASQGGQVIDVVGPADTLARMAGAVGVTADEMSAAGRDDVASAMTNLRTVGTLPDGKLWMQEDKGPELAALREWLDKPEGERSATPPVTSLTLWRWDQLLDATRARVEDEFELLRFTVDAVSRHAFPKKRDREDVRNDERLAPQRRRDYDRAAHDEEHTIEEEQEYPEFP